MGTNNPSEEQLALVEARIIALADTVVDPGLPMDENSYFDEHGFDLESAAGQLAVKLKAYIKDAEDVEPSLEDHPQVRRMARYLLENVDYEVLEAPLSNELLQMKAGTSPKGSAGGGGGALSRPALLGGLALIVLVLCVLAFVMFGGGDAAKSHGHMGNLHTATYGGGGGGRGGRGSRRNGSNNDI